MADDEKRIIIDEDWKSQVQREKEQAAQAAETPADDEIDEHEPLDFEASFESLVASLATQTMLALGVIAPEGAEQIPINLGQAKFMIDTLEMLKEKTAGNLTEEEDAHLTEAVSELQHVFALRVQQYQQQAMQQGGIDPTQMPGQGG